MPAAVAPAAGSGALPATAAPSIGTPARPAAAVPAAGSGALPATLARSLTPSQALAPARSAAGLPPAGSNATPVLQSAGAVAAPSRPLSGVDAIRAGMAAATSGGGRRVRIARVPGAAAAPEPDRPPRGRLAIQSAAHAEPATAPSVSPARAALARIDDGSAATTPQRQDIVVGSEEAARAREATALIAALPAAAAAMRSAESVSRTVEFLSDSRPAGGVLQRVDDVPAPAPAPARVPARPPAPAAGEAVDAEDRRASGSDIDELYDRVTARLRADLRDDRERRGDLLGWGPS